MVTSKNRGKIMTIFSILNGKIPKYSECKNTDSKTQGKKSRRITEEVALMNF